jgi:hypothetical protein
MYHKPLEKLGYLHNKALNQLQSALQEHEFIIQYNKGFYMPADYLSRLPAMETTNPVALISASDPFQSNLRELQLKGTALQILQEYLKMGNWLPDLKPSCRCYALAMKE